MDTRIVQRFLTERNVLARFEHSNIARLIDGGATEDGQPWLAMEFVEGVPVDQYCRQRRLRVRQIIELMLQVCSAVDCAHSHLIVHRDIKPSNVLVTAGGVPKLLDFGIAKLIDEHAVAMTLTGHQPMTPAYASPEQVAGKAVNTASDVFSLGVLLYRLFTSRVPWRIDPDSGMTIHRAILEQDPDPPSQAPDTPGQMRRALRGDLDAIVLRALEKDPRRRYPSVGRFSGDLRRYLSGLPVDASSGAAVYRMRKYLGRHAAAISAAAVTAITLFAGTAVSIQAAARAERARTIAVSRFEEVRRIARFVLFDLDGAIQAGPEPTRKAVVAMGLDSLARIESANRDTTLGPEIAAAYCRIGDIQGNPFRPNLGDVNAARASYVRAANIAGRLAALPGNTHTAAIARAMAAERLGELALAEGNRVGARRNLDEARQVLRAVGGAHDADRLLRDLATRPLDF